MSDPDLCTLPKWIAGLPGTIRYFQTGAMLAEDLRNKTCWSLLELTGVPKPGQVRLPRDRKHIPTEAELRRYVFPSVLAATVDDRGYRVIHRQPLPFAGLTSEVAFRQKWSVRWKGYWPEMRYSVAVTPPRNGSGK